MRKITSLPLCLLTIAAVISSEPVKAGDDDDTQRDLVVRLTSKCAVSKSAPEVAQLAAAILAPLAIAAVEKSIDAAGVALVKAGDDKTEKYLAATSDSFYEIIGKDIGIAKNRRCLTIFKEGDSGQLTGPWEKGSPRDAGSIEMRANPDFYFEAYFEESEDRTAFRIAPRHIEYGNNLWDSMWTDTRDIIITVDFSRPSNEQGKAFASSTFLISNVRPGQKLDSLPKGAYMPLPAIDEELKGSILRLEQAARERDQLRREPTKAELDLNELQRQLAVIATKDSVAVQRLRLGIARLERQVKLESLERELASTAPMEQEEEEKIEVVPVNVNVTVAETRDGSKLLLAVGQILQGASPDIKAAGKKAINDALLPSAIEAKKVAKQASQLGVLTSDLEVLENAKKVAELPVDALPEARAVAEQNLRIAQYKANIAYQAAGLSAPYPDARP